VKQKHNPELISILGYCLHTMKNISRNISLIFSTVLLWLLYSCNNSTSSNKQKAEEITPQPPKHALTKPPGTYPDTSNIYKSLIHEYYYQMLTARTLLKRNWPALKIIESKRNRFLLFIKKDNTRECIDLDTKNDTHGLFVFDGKKTPVPVDMTNLETGVSSYLAE
jgi:hypothetical protein